MKRLVCLAIAACGPSGTSIHPADDGGGGEAASDTPSEGDPNLFATASGTVDVFVNGMPAGSTTTPGAVIANTRLLVDGDNSIVLRARRGTAAQPFAHAQIGGSFGAAGTSSLWKAKVATPSEATEPIGAWAMPDFDDSSWSRASDVGVAPSAPFPVDGPAHGIWTAQPADETVLLRLRLYVPAGWSADTPVGFGRGVTGGSGGAVITVTTPAELSAAVAGATPKIVRIAGVIDFTGTEGPITSNACYQAQCSPPLEDEYIVDRLGDCNGKTTFPVTYDKAGTTPLAVGSNTTIIGASASAAIQGKGLSIAHGTTNVIVRNLTITTINPQIVWGGDAIHIDDASNVWIDHVRIALIARQMIVTGFGSASNVTLSWNEFDGRTPYSSFCDGAHFWLMLFLGASDTITVSNNWIHDTSGRGPHAGGLNGATSSVQFVNDYYDHIGVAAQPITIYAKLLYEGTYFSNVTKPFQIDTTTAPAPGHAFAPLTSTAACQTTLGRPCVANLAIPQNGSFPLDQAVLDAFGATGNADVVVPYPAAKVPDAVPHLAGPGRI